MRMLALRWHWLKPIHTIDSRKPPSYRRVFVSSRNPPENQMPDQTLYLDLAFIAAVTILMALPGPNVALIVPNSLAHGPKYGLVTVAGTSSSMVVQLAVTVVGVAGLLSSIADWFEWLRWIGVAYPDFDAFGYVRRNGCVPGWAVDAVGWTVAPAS
jgi:LysE type translocator